MPRLRTVRALSGTAVLCVFTLFLAQCASDATDETCDAGCVAGEACRDGACVDESLASATPERPVEAQWGPKQENGGTCTSGRDCYSGECADGVCCDSACDGACDACDLAGSEGVCSVAPQGAACADDDNPCTTDACDAAGTCLHPALTAGTGCGVGNVCDAEARCAPGCWIDGMLRAPGATNPTGACQVCDPAQSTTAWSFKPASTQCRAASSVCDAAEYCTGSSAQCPADGNVANGSTCGTSTEGAWGSCGGFAGTCGESGTQSRPVTSQVCLNGLCQSSTSTESRACSRSREGVSCSSGAGGWGACQFSGTCSNQGTRYREVYGGVCSGGSCQGSSSTESESCYRDTEGESCGGMTTGGWSACGYSSFCDETGSRARSITERVCSAGACRSVTSTETEDCGRNTTGQNCGPEVSDWSTCSGFSGACGRTGYQVRRVYQLACVNGGCYGISNQDEVRSCERDTTGASCDDGNACTTGDTCDSGGGCSGSQMSCPGGGSCSGGVCGPPPNGCSGGQTKCGGFCTDIYNDDNNCGGCGIKCSAAHNEVCSSGWCTCVQTPGSPYQCP
ncbi:hypothetical protein HJC10_36085 [Corallococcus exiguus]|uniref:hypothetical protein n=1 Tax=Corallococcus exiguus TaxID=83462 RepID=UPI0014711F2B|nr:hypothetical protein [Corallococcus exiguus]NNB89235.1 hypothetical protein [Corallococcus exiguus]NNB96761.1 hypothetical protein [Corallococcus exiguus]NNC08246.1 hypothetical protein [Corallococcus exiguus]